MKMGEESDVATVQFIHGFSPIIGCDRVLHCVIFFFFSFSFFFFFFQQIGAINTIGGIFGEKPSTNDPCIDC